MTLNIGVKEFLIGTDRSEIADIKLGFNLINEFHSISVCFTICICWQTCPEGDGVGSHRIRSSRVRIAPQSPGFVILAFGDYSAQNFSFSFVRCLAQSA